VIKTGDTMAVTFISLVSVAAATQTPADHLEQLVNGARVLREVQTLDITTLRDDVIRLRT
jgi:hypothetical protein